ncbi:MAG: polysaccharide deacetylase family protein [Mariprofundaceae bacterium]|nr:polysaccharide deacetylase family protein [Mariprofundaceae bacterium]
MFKRALRTVGEHVIGTAFSVFPGLKKRTLGNITVFIFHEVNDSPSEFTNRWGLGLTEKTFQTQISWINDNFNIIHPNLLLEKNAAKLPECAAVITFDDGFAGAFENGISYLVKNSIPCIMFLNMRTVLERRAMLSALVFYLETYVPAFLEFVKTEKIAPPTFLNFTPEQLKKYETQHGPIDMSEAIKYQGEVADLDLVKKWGKNELVVLGNHLFDHWNSTALSPEQFSDQYQKNVQALHNINSKAEFFSFTNGQPGKCFSDRDVELLKNLGAHRIFFSLGYANHDTGAYLLDRVSLFERENNSRKLWFRMVLDAFLYRSKTSSV